MAKIFYTITIVFICFTFLHALHNSKSKTLSKLKAISPAVKVLTQYGRNQGWTTFNALPRSAVFYDYIYLC